jgi:hypothetical protein
LFCFCFCFFFPVFWVLFFGRRQFEPKMSLKRQNKRD